MFLLLEDFDIGLLRSDRKENSVGPGSVELITVVLRTKNPPKSINPVAFIRIWGVLVGRRNILLSVKKMAVLMGDIDQFYNESPSA